MATVIDATQVLPDDPELPGLVAIRERGLAGAISAVGFGADAVELRLRGYTKGRRATLEARVGGRHLAIQCWARRPAEEAFLHQALAAAGLTAEDSAVRVPPLLHWDPFFRVTVTGWLEGPSARELIATGQGERAGELAARWVRRSASLDVRMGPDLGAEEVLSRARPWAAALEGADASLAPAATALVTVLSATLPPEPERRLVHGRLYGRHVLGLGDACGVIDWGAFGQGPLELDAGMFLAALWRSGQHEDLSREAARAEAAFLDATAELLDERRLAWHRGAALLCLTHHLLARRDDTWVTKARGLLLQALGVAETIGRTSSAGRRMKADLLVRPAVLVETLIRSAADAHPGDRSLGPDAESRTFDRAPSGPEANAAQMTRAHPPFRAGGDAPPARSTLTELDLALMRVLWARGEATVHQMANALEPPLSQSTVASRISRLEEKQVVTHRVAGRQNLYRAAIGQSELQRTFVEDFALLTDELFDGDVAVLVCQLVRARDVNAKDLARVIALLRAHEQELEGNQE